MKDYVLVVAEKPDAARQIAKALDSDSEMHGYRSSAYWVAHRKDVLYVVCPASGHLFTIEGESGKSGIYPVFDVFWARSKGRAAGHAGLFARLAKEASGFVVACDYDVEGEAIGYNVLKYACGVAPERAVRAKFSTLASEDILASFENLESRKEWPLAIAGRTRHVLDFVWGINLSRALSLSGLFSGRRYMNLSMGRVQGPTLNFVYERERERNLFVPLPYWQVSAEGTKDGAAVRLLYEKEPTNGREAEAVKEETERKYGSVEEMKEERFGEPPPPAFNLGMLQKEAFRMFGFSPAATLALAESLYLKALISYPRTSSEQLPASIGYAKILSRLGEHAAYGGLVGDLTGRTPRQGKQSDAAHPAIFPTGLRPAGLDGRESKLYDLVVRRFLAAFSRPAVKLRTSLSVRNNGHLFRASGVRLLVQGYLKIYRFGGESKDVSLGEFQKGDEVFFGSVEVLSKFTQPPFRYNAGSLLARMEKEDIGTKATRAEIISTLEKRGYVEGRSMEMTDLGMVVIEAVKGFYPDILSVGFTRSLEQDLERMDQDAASAGRTVVAGAREMLKALDEFEKNRGVLGPMIGAGYGSAARKKSALGACPVCRKGELLIIRSRTSGKRFVGCSNYSSDGCRASAPLPQRGGIRKAGASCKGCGWPVVNVFFARGRPWRLCLNVACPSKRKKLPVEGKHAEQYKKRNA